jgi:predicted O-linked N-acetylglucosamine transferase (SPINDLY family)
LCLKTKDLGEPVNRDRIKAKLIAWGIAAERVVLKGANADWQTHMAEYNTLDIALDPVGGLGGATTTCEALWMGVPVVTLQGETMAQRMTASMLHALGQSEWAATTESDYINVVRDLVHDVALRQHLRQHQRQRMAQSPLCDARGLARSLEAAYTAMYDAWSVNGNAHTRR